MAALRTVILGGYGLFGRRLASRLARMDGLELVIAGRSPQKARDCVAQLEDGACVRLEPAMIDVEDAGFTQRLAALRPGIVIHTAGPFQQQDYRVARACVAAGADYADLADARAFVCGIGALDEAARQAGVRVISGASSVPALSSAACDLLAQGLERVDAIDIGISPGNRTERGLATVQAILGYCGKPIESRFGPPGVAGWLGSWTHEYGAPVGRRLLSPCDVPDLDLLGARHAGTPRVRFGAGLELRLLHRAMNLLAWTARRGWASDWSRQARSLRALADLFIGLGSDADAMHVRMHGRDGKGQVRGREWELIALQGHGPFVPTLAAAALVRKRLRGESAAPGARPCVGLLRLQDFSARRRAWRSDGRSDPYEHEPVRQRPGCTVHAASSVPAAVSPAARVP